MLRSLIFCFSVLPLVSRAQATLHLELWTAKPASGSSFHVALCPSRKAYITNRDCVTRTVPVQGPVSTCIIDSLFPGTYAVKVFQDVNGNAVLDKSWLGWPVEPVGYSNEAPINSGEPPFRLAAFSLGAGSHTERILLR